MVNTLYQGFFSLQKLVKIGESDRAWNLGKKADASPSLDPYMTPLEV